MLQLLLIKLISYCVDPVGQVVAIAAVVKRSVYLIEYVVSYRDLLFVFHSIISPLLYPNRLASTGT